jgi:hypothetical protein
MSSPRWSFMKKLLIQSFGSAIVFSFLCLTLWGLYRLGHVFNIFPPSTYVLNSDQTPPTDKTAAKVLENLIQDRKLLSVNQVYTWTLDYYDRIFSTLIALIGVLAAISYFYIRTASGEEAKEEIKKEVQDRVKIHLESHDYMEKLYEQFGDPEIDELKAQVRTLQEGMEFLKQSKAFDLETKLKTKPSKKKKKK